MTTIAAWAHAVKYSLYLKQELSNFFFLFKQLDYKYLLHSCILKVSFAGVMFVAG